MKHRIMKWRFFILISFIAVMLQNCSMVEKVGVVSFANYSTLYHDIPDSLNSEEIRSLINNYPFTAADRIMLNDLWVKCQDCSGDFNQLSPSKKRKLKRKALKYGCNTIFTYEKLHNRNTGLFDCGCDSLTVSELDSLMNINKK